MAGRREGAGTPRSRKERRWAGWDDDEPAAAPAATEPIEQQLAAARGEVAEAEAATRELAEAERQIAACESSDENLALAKKVAQSLMGS